MARRKNRDNASDASDNSCHSSDFGELIKSKKGISLPFKLEDS